jgi:2-hydroxy-3-keto-5-methylthiopentenyl-1-phosphate phosphatase
MAYIESNERYIYIGPPERSTAAETEEISNDVFARKELLLHSVAHCRVDPGYLRFSDILRDIESNLH